jgi:hypothetical protein
MTPYYLTTQDSKSLPQTEVSVTHVNPLCYTPGQAILAKQLKYNIDFLLAVS